MIGAPGCITPEPSSILSKTWSDSSQFQARSHRNQTTTDSHQNRSKRNQRD
ncbi:hypothetical protein SynMVIR181_02418 [Synechococcus sp. MVIR-18-1]|nr:hypothetical protein SynMVIR181_02418 [Synechococcus sp. MVIR-18-1]